MPDTKKPLLFYNSNVNKMIIAFPHRTNLFELHLDKQKDGWYDYDRDRLHKSNKQEYIRIPLVNNNELITDPALSNKWHNAKFRVSKSGKFMSRSFPKQYTSIIRPDRQDESKEVVGYMGFAKEIKNMLSRECKII